jgi:hypothetical protein
MDNLVSLLRAPGAINNEVRGKILELIQLWASAFEGNPSLSYVGDVYRNLKATGFDFPPPTEVSSTFVDSSAVSWQSSPSFDASLTGVKAAGLDRFRCLHALSNGFHIY